MNRLLYYCFILPISLLPLSIIYLLGNVFYFFLCYITPYRRSVIDKNLKASFPNKSDQEIKVMRSDFYRYFADLMAESVKLLTIKKEDLLKRIAVVNPEIMDKLHEKNQNVILISSHVYNWEYTILAQDLLFKHKAFGIGMPLTSEFWNKKITARRERYGMVVANALNYKEKLLSNREGLTSTLVLNDQNPGKAENCFWSSFLNQETAFYFGAEVMANQMNSAIVYADLSKVKRGFYEVELKLITHNPKVEEYGFVTKQYIDLLEASIRRSPHAWLWSHKRWKKSIPENLDQLKKEHKERFNKRFRSESTLRESA